MAIPLRSSKGQKIYDFLKEELQIPDGAIRFSVHLGVDELITVDCSYYPQECDHDWLETTAIHNKHRHYVCNLCGEERKGESLNTRP